MSNSRNVQAVVSSDGTVIVRNNAGDIYDVSVSAAGGVQPLLVPANPIPTWSASTAFTPGIINGGDGWYYIVPQAYTSGSTLNGDIIGLHLERTGLVGPSAPPSGAAGGDLAGTYPNPTLSQAAKSTLVGVNAQTDNYTLVLTDAGKLVTLANAGAKSITVPLNASVAFPLYTVIPVASYGAGVITIAVISGVTLQSSGGKVTLATQYAAGSLTKVGTDTWLLAGNLT